MKYSPKYEFPIDDIARRQRADASAGVYLLDGRWHLAAHDSTAEDQLVGAGALLVATLTFTVPARPTDVAVVSTAAALQFYATQSC